ncbi:MAG: DNA polymerase III subunit beta [Candidatus Beckwithbacteria bacterium]|nr:DNA polymerase III subunit beta [Candidatus Beckwithbacteria bacterium]
MKVSLLQENLAKGVGVVSRAVATKTQLPVLANILITTDQGKLKLTTTNLETGINLWLGGKVEKEGKITIPARILNEAISSLPAGTVELIAEADKLKISCGKYKAEINGINAEEFPAVPSLKNKKTSGQGIKIDREIIETGINQVAVAAATDEGRPVFTGVKMELGEGGLRLAATDGYRLSVKTISGLKGIKKKKEMIVPARALMELIRVLGAAETEVKEVIFEATEEEKQLILSFGEGEVVTRLLEGEFPDFDKIVPQTHTTTIELNTEELTQAVRAAAVFAKDSANIVKFKITDGGLLISANTPQVGGNEVEVAGKKTGETGEIAFNSRYLIEMLNAIGAKELKLEISGPLNPGVFKPLGDNSFLHIIMPVRVQA